jgi:hypothetical protein
LKQVFVCMIYFLGLYLGQFYDAQVR